MEKKVGQVQTILCKQIKNETVRVGHLVTQLVDFVQETDARLPGGQVGRQNVGLDTPLPDAAATLSLQLKWFIIS